DSRGPSSLTSMGLTWPCRGRRETSSSFQRPQSRSEWLIAILASSLNCTGNCPMNLAVFGAKCTDARSRKRRVTPRAGRRGGATPTPRQLKLLKFSGNLDWRFPHTAWGSQGQGESYEAMKTSPLFTLEGPLCAVEDSGARTMEVCPGCGRGKRTQTGTLSVAVVCSERDVWLTDANAVLISLELGPQLEALPGIELHPARARWREGIPGRGEIEPIIWQVRARHPIHAAPQ